MARGWESKSVEAQIEEAAVERGAHRPRPLDPEQAADHRRRQGLELSRRRVLQQLQNSPHPRHRRLLEETLADLDAQLARLDQPARLA